MNQNDHMPSGPSVVWLVVNQVLPLIQLFIDTLIIGEILFPYSLTEYSAKRRVAEIYIYEIWLFEQKN